MTRDTGAKEIVRAALESVSYQTRDLMDAMGADMKAAGLTSPQALRDLGRPMIGFSEAMLERLNPLRRFLFTRMYRHPSVNRMMSKAKRVLAEMFRLLMDEPDLLPDEWRVQAKGCRDSARARIVADYIAGMTDRYALKEHRALFDPHIRT